MREYIVACNKGWAYRVENKDGYILAEGSAYFCQKMCEVANAAFHAGQMKVLSETTNKLQKMAEEL